MFDLFGHERLTAWKLFRDDLETSDNPLELVAEFWAKAPFVSKYLDPYDPLHWPDAWHLILDGKYDALAIALGMYYTLKLTVRFSNINQEIYMTANQKDPLFFLMVDNTSILNLEYKKVSHKKEITNHDAIKIFPRHNKN